MSGTTKRGFASMSEEKQREIASKGGRAAHAKGTAHEFSREEAQAAGRKGGLAVSRNREHMAAIGRKGGMESGGRSRRQSDKSSEGETPVSDAGDEVSKSGTDSSLISDTRFGNDRADSWRPNR